VEGDHAAEGAAVMLAGGFFFDQDVLG